MCAPGTHEGSLARRPPVTNLARRSSCTVKKNIPGSSLSTRITWKAKTSRDSHGRETFGTFTPDSVNTRGSVILIRKNCLTPGSTIIHKELFPGRDHLVQIRCEDSLCTIVNVHFQLEGTLALMGDFNISDPDEGRLNARNQTFSDGDARRAAVLLASFTRSVEIGQPSFTGKDGRRDTNIPMAELCDCRCYAPSIGCVGERRIPSDHVAARLTTASPQGRCGYHPVIRQRLPLFISALDDLHKDNMYDEDPLVPLDQFEEMALSASIMGQTLGCLYCAAGLPVGTTQTIKKYFLAYLPVARCFDQQLTACINFRALCNIIESLTRDNMRNHDDELTELTLLRQGKPWPSPNAPRAAKLGCQKNKTLLCTRLQMKAGHSTTLMKQQIAFVNIGEPCSAPWRAPPVLSCLIPCSLSSNPLPRHALGNLV